MVNQRMNSYYSELEDVEYQAERRARDLEDQINSLHNEYQYYIQDTRARQEDMRRSFKNQLAKSEKRAKKRHDALEKSFRREVKELRSDFNEEFDKQRAALQKERKRINKLEKIAGDAITLAKNTAGAASFLVNYLRKTYSMHSSISSGSLNLMEERLRRVEENIQLGQGAAALSLAQETLLEAEDMHLHLENYQQQWEAAQGLALTTVKAALTVTEDSKEYQADFTDEHLMLPVDFWSGGAWTEVKEQLDALKLRLEDTNNPLSLEQIEEASENTSVLLEELENTIRNAQRAAYASVLREDMQLSFYDKLKESGFVLVDNAWEGNDERESNHLVMKSAFTDEKIAVVIRPVVEPDGQVGYQMEINFSEKSPSEVRRREKIQNISEMLSSVYDIQTSFTPMPGEVWTKNAPESVFDLTEVREKKTRE
ncbi:MAG: hypothetical protein GX130_08625 [Candidatus Hydrogenedens sp.]|jgi:hypothetical protein|nr:hypothetical protein [Candidatus Hydrogenedens sp.]